MEHFQLYCETVKPLCYSGKSVRKQQRERLEDCKNHNSSREKETWPLGTLEQLKEMALTHPVPGDRESIPVPMASLIQNPAGIHFLSSGQASIEGTGMEQ